MMLLNLLWILAPLFIGFFTVIRSKKILKLIDHSLMALIYLILLVLGLNLAAMANGELHRLYSWYEHAVFLLFG